MTHKRDSKWYVGFDIAIRHVHIKGMVSNMEVVIINSIRQINNHESFKGRTNNPSEKLVVRKEICLRYI